MILSILIPTIPDRVDMFTSLYNEVMRQVAYMNTTHPSLGNIQVLVDGSPKFLDGGLSIGKKREGLVKQATGKFLCFLDDDEGIAPNYVETLVRLCQHDRDVCTFMNVSKFDNFWMVVDMSIHYPNDQASPMHITRRRPWHICPVRSSFAKQFVFHDISYGEDFSWMDKVLTLCTSEAKSNAVIHQYNHSSHTSEADRITKQLENVVPE